MSKYDKMLEVNHKQSVEKIQRAKLAIQEMIEEEDKVTVPKLMQKTGLSRGFFYKNPEVRKAVDRALQLQAGMVDKRSLKWENIKCYWDRYKITPELLQYIETNSDQLTFLENQCLNEVFAEELITSTIDDSAFEKLLPQLELEFDIPIEKVERQKVGILIKKKYIPFDVNKYGEIKDAYPDLCPDFILYNQAEYMEVMEKIPMGETLLETLLLSPILDFSNAEVLLDAFGENYMTAKIAENLVDSNVTINKSIFTAAWEYVDEKGKKTLMFKCLSILEAADFENCFSELSQWYSGFCDRSKKHSVELPNNEESQRLAKRLQEVSYITSYKLQEKEVYDSVTETKKKKSTFVCWIKAIKG